MSFQPNRIVFITATISCLVLNDITRKLNNSNAVIIIVSPLREYTKVPMSLKCSILYQCSSASLFFHALESHMFSVIFEKACC